MNPSQACVKQYFREIGMVGAEVCVKENVHHKAGTQEEGGG